MTAKTLAKTETKPSLNDERSGILQRKCDCGKSAGLTGQCSECQSKRLTRQPGNIAQTTAAPILHDLIQPKLRVGVPDDKYEQEADQVADQIMRMPALQLLPKLPFAQPTFPVAIQQLNRSDVEPLRQQEVKENEEGAIQAKGQLEQTPMVTPTLEARLKASQGKGQPLPDEVRSFMEPRFRTDFSEVQVHTGGEAVQMNRELNAQAFTHKQDVYFGAGKAPGKNALTAHELAHVVQQTGEWVQRAPEQSWIGERINWVRTATRTDNWANSDPPGAYYVLNGLSIDDMVRIMRALTPADRKKLSENLDEHGAGFDRSRIQLALTNVETVPGDKWWRDLSEKVHWAIRSNKFVEYPDGAFWVINPLNEQDTIKIMNFLHRDSLSELIANGNKAIEAGVPNAKRILAAARNRAGIPMGGTYDDYKSNPDYIDNFNSAAYSPLSKTLHLFFDNGGEAILTLPLKSQGVVLVFQWKSLLNSPGAKDLKIYPYLQTKNTLPNVTQWLADHDDEMQQSDLLLSAGIGALNARSLPPNLWWLAALAPMASLGARFTAGRMRPAFKTVKPEPDEIPIIKAPAKIGKSTNTSPETPTNTTSKTPTQLPSYAGSVGEIAEGSIIRKYYANANQLPPKYPGYDAVRGGNRTYIQKQEKYNGQYVSIIEETIKGGEWISIKTIEPQTATPKGIDKVVKEAIFDMANKSGKKLDPVPYGDSYLRVMEAKPDKIVLHIESPVKVTQDMQNAAKNAATFYSKGMLDAPIEVIVVGP